MATSVEEKLKNRLNLKYNAAAKLVQQARQECCDGDATTIDDAVVLETATSIFQGLSEQEQEKLMNNNFNTNGSAGGKAEEPEWKKKARLAAQKREQEWQAQAATRAAGTDPNAPPPAENGGGAGTISTTTPLEPNVIKYVTTRQIGGGEKVTTTLTQEPQITPPNKENTKKTICYCVIL